MVDRPGEQQLREALKAAGSAHHEYEQGYLGGERDEAWPGWYAAYVLGRLGDFATPSELTRWLEEAPADDDWSESAAAFVLERLSLS